MAMPACTTGTKSVQAQPARMGDINSRPVNGTMVAFGSGKGGARVVWICGASVVKETFDTFSGNGITGSIWSSRTQISTWKMIKGTIVTQPKNCNATRSPSP
mmetsp:Transcript_41071/g.60286  ORF Transcript_41071/g.60286 Transcript_41071/m.60286 type:complete len:102 (-) Transcript_41071:992-1297(-)